VSSSNAYAIHDHRTVRAYERIGLDRCQREVLRQIVRPPEVPAAGHDRCIVPIPAKSIDAWLCPDRGDLASLYAILDDRERPYYEHKLAA